MTAWPAREAVEALRDSGEHYEPTLLARGLRDYADAIEAAVDEGHTGQDALDAALERMGSVEHL